MRAARTPTVVADLSNFLLMLGASHRAPTRRSARAEPCVRRRSRANRPALPEHVDRRQVRRPGPSSACATIESVIAHWELTESRSRSRSRNAPTSSPGESGSSGNVDTRQKAALDASGNFDQHTARRLHAIQDFADCDFQREELDANRRSVVHRLEHRD
jgi:hypothetical protein